jgi:hypothetical protein
MNWRIELDLEDGEYDGIYWTELAQDRHLPTSSTLKESCRTSSTVHR